MMKGVRPPTPNTGTIDISVSGKMLVISGLPPGVEILAATHPEGRHCLTVKARTFFPGIRAYVVRVNGKEVRT